MYWDSKYASVDEMFWKEQSRKKSPLFDSQKKMKHIISIQVLWRAVKKSRQRECAELQSLLINKCWQGKKSVNILSCISFWRLLDIFLSSLLLAKLFGVPIYNWEYTSERKYRKMLSFTLKISHDFLLRQAKLSWNLLSLNYIKQNRLKDVLC